MLFVRFALLSWLVYGVRTAKIDTVPVFLIDQSSLLVDYEARLQPNPLARTTTPEFLDIVQPIMQRSDSIIMFIEQKLCTEDISIRERRGTPFFHLHSGLMDKKVKYLPNVVQPYKSLSQLFRPQQYNTFNLSFSFKPHQLLKHMHKYYYIFFNDSLNKTRAEVLRDHDSIIREVCLIIQRLFTNPVLAIYTGISNPIKSLKSPPVYVRKMRKVSDGLVVSEGALFKLSGVYSTSALRRAAFDHTPEIEEQSWRRNGYEDFTRMSTRMSYSDFDLQFNFTLRQNDWTLDTVMLLEGGEEVGLTHFGVGLPWGRSYICWRPLVIINRRDASYIVISQYQLEPIKPCKYLDNIDDYDESTNDSSSHVDPTRTLANSYFFLCKRNTYRMQTTDEGPVFHAAEHCEPYFTHQIIAALMITFLLLFILFSGIVMLMDCHGNGRYDDPHGKTIVVSAAI